MSTKAKKIYKVKKFNGKTNDVFYEGTLESLINTFSYTLEIGNSYNPKIQRTPKTINSFINNLQKAFEEKEASCYERTFVSLVN